MNWLDRALRDWRIRRATPWIPDHALVLDVGCFDDSLFRRLGSRLRFGTGVDPMIDAPLDGDRFRLIPGDFPDVPRPDVAVDVVTMLAVLEHVPSDDLDRWARACRQLLAPGGLVVATFPSPAVDRILDVLLRLRLLHGMEFGQHHGADPRAAVRAFETAGFSLLRWRRFQLGLNNLIVLRRETGESEDGPETTGRRDESSTLKP